MPPIVTPAQNRDGYQFQQFASGNLQDPLNPEAIANGRPPILKQVARGAAPGLVFHWTTISMSVLAVTLCLLLTNGGGH